MYDLGFDVVFLLACGGFRYHYLPEGLYIGVGAVGSSVLAYGM